MARYQDREITQINLDYARFNSAQLGAIKGVKTKNISIAGLELFGPIHSDGFIKLLQNKVLSSPAKLKLNDRSSKGFDDNVLQKIIQQKLQFAHLDLSSTNIITSQKFCKFVEQEGLSSPCELNISGCQWVNHQVIQAFIKAKVQFSRLDISNCHCLLPSQIKELIKSDCLLPECSFLFETFKKHLLKRLLKIRLN